MSSVGDGRNPLHRLTTLHPLETVRSHVANRIASCVPALRRSFVFLPYCYCFYVALFFYQSDRCFSLGYCLCACLLELFDVIQVQRNTATRALALVGGIFMPH